MSFASQISGEAKRAGSCRQRQPKPLESLDRSAFLAGTMPLQGTLLRLFSESVYGSGGQAGALGRANYHRAKGEKFSLPLTAEE